MKSFIDQLPFKIRVSFIGIIVLFIFLIGVVFSSNIAWLMSGRHYGSIKTTEIISLVQSPIKRDIKSSRIAILLGTLAAGFMLIFIFKNRGNPLHGKARFANYRDIKKSNLSSPTGILCGKYGRDFLCFGGNEHVMLYAPTGAGKGVGVVIPNLLTWQDSTIVADIKKENWHLTAGFREKAGHQVYLFDPLDPDGRTARYNPFGYIDRSNIIELYDELGRIGTMLYPPEGNNPFWSNAAQAAFMGLAGFVAETPSLPFSFGEILRQATQPKTQEALKKAIEARKTSDDPLSSQCITALSDFVFIENETFQNVRKTLTSKLNLWINPRVDAATSASDFDLRELRKKPISIYLGVTPDNLIRLAPLINLFFQQAVDLNIRTLPEHDPTTKYKLMLMMDELPALGFLPVIVSAIAYLRGYGVRMVSIVQSPSQLRAIYGADLAKNYMTNHSVEIVYPTKDEEDLRDLSERFGYDTIDGTSISKNGGFSGGRSKTTSDQRRALMLPQEIKLASSDEAYVLTAGISAIKAKKIVYYRQKLFSQRILPPPEINKIAIIAHQNSMIFGDEKNKVEDVQEILITPTIPLLIPDFRSATDDVSEDDVVDIIIKYIDSGKRSEKKTDEAMEVA